MDHDHRGHSNSPHWRSDLVLPRRRPRHSLLPQRRRESTSREAPIPPCRPNTLSPEIPLGRCQRRSHRLENLCLFHRPVRHRHHALRLQHFPPHHHRRDGILVHCTGPGPYHPLLRSGRNRVSGRGLAQRSLPTPCVIRLHLLRHLYGWLRDSHLRYPIRGTLFRRPTHRSRSLCGGWFTACLVTN